MRKDVTIVIIIMVGIMSFIAGYSMSPTEIKTCPDEFCSKAGETADAARRHKCPEQSVSHEEAATISEEQPVASEYVEEPAHAVKSEKEVSGYDIKKPTPAEPAKKVAPTPEKQPAESEEEVGGYGEEEYGGY